MKNRKVNTSLMLTVTQLTLSALASVSIASISVSQVQAKTNTSTLDGLKIGVNAIYSDKGFTDYDNEVAILPSLFYDNDTIYARGNSVGYNFIKDRKNELSGFVQYTGVGYDPENASSNSNSNANLTKLDERDSSVFAGASYIHLTPYGGLRGQVATDVMGDSEGSIVRLTYLARYKNGGLTLYPSAGLQWQDENYNDYYYGVTEKESSNSGVTDYSPSDSINPYVSVMGMYDITEDWGLFANQSVAYNTDEQYDSPKIDSRTVFTSMFGLTYGF